MADLDAQDSPGTTVVVALATDDEEQAAAAQEALLDPVLRATLEEVGASRLQVDLVHGGAGPRGTGPGLDGVAPVAAVATLRVSGPLVLAVDAVAEVVRTDAPEVVVHAWAVRDHTRVAAPDVPDGEEHDGNPTLTFVRRPEEVATEAWLARWDAGRPAPGGVLGLVERLVTADLDGSGPRVDAVVDTVTETVTPADGPRPGPEAAADRRDPGGGTALVLATSRLTWQLDGQPG